MAQSKSFYDPIGSSYITSDISNLIKSAQYSNIIGSVDALTVDMFRADSYHSKFEVNIRGASAGEIFNLYQKMILNSQWDCRDNGDYQTILLGREYMFYKVDDKIKSVSVVKNDDINREMKYKIFYSNPINFFKIINETMISDGITHIYDEGTILKSGVEPKVKKTNNLKKMLERDKCRKFSENHFAIAGFNLITHSIKTNSDVPNTISEVFDGDEKNTISILGDVDNQYISEIIVTPELPSSSVTSDDMNEHRNDEFLANKLLEELRYVYQGNIIIKFNPDIEIGDTITLFDDVTSTFGIFQVDSFEHSLGQRGLLTNLIVRASWELKDPVLDHHSQEIGYKLINNLPKHFLISNYGDERKKIHKLTAVYLKSIVQFPKYCTIYSKRQKTFFDSSTVRCENVLSPTALPLRFFPMYIKGVQQMPKSLEAAFVSKDNNSFASLFSKIYAKFRDSFNSFVKGFSISAGKILYFVSDIIISTITFNLSELFKPLIGMTSNQAMEKTFDEVKTMDKEDVFNVLHYNPYDKKYRLMYSGFDYVFGFFNVRLQNRDDLYAANKLLEKNESNDKKLLSRKIQTVVKLMNDVFDTLFLVELYDGFKITTNGKQYKMNDFLKECTASDSIRLEHTEEIMKNYYGSEYGAILTRNNSSLDISKNNCRTINLANGRKAIELTVDVSSMNIGRRIETITKTENVYSDIQQSVDVGLKRYITKIIFIFFHNLYGTTMEEKGKSSVNERRENVKTILDAYKQYSNSYDTGVVIMADFNLNVYNWSLGEKHYDGKADDTNFIYKLENDDFIAQIKSATTLNKYGFLTGNQYDNVLLSKNLHGIITAKVFEYPEKDKLTISDHVPVYVGIKKMQE